MGLEGWNPDAGIFKMYIQCIREQHFKIFSIIRGMFCMCILYFLRLVYIQEVKYSIDSIECFTGRGPADDEPEGLRGSVYRGHDC